jgi:hypothetical protein
MAGFPVSWLLQIQSPVATGWVRDFLAAEDALLASRSDYLGWLFDQRREAADARTRNAANRGSRLVWRLKPVPTGELPAMWPERLDAWNVMARERERLLAVASAGWAAEMERLTGVLRRTAGLPDLQEAVFLNSPGALTGIRRFVGGRNSAPLRRLAVRYLQRFCMKVETGGFYGPINHGQFAPDSPDALLLNARGDGRAAPRHTLLSYWAAQAIASAWANDERLAGLLRLYRAARRDAGTGPAPDRRLMALATGDYTLESIAAQLDMPLDALRTLVLDAQSRGWLRAGIRIPFASGDPLAALRDLVEDSVTVRRADLFKQLASVAGLLSDFEKADLAERERLLAEGNDLVEALTGTVPSRATGRFYTDRFWYTEEAIGNLGRVTFGQPVAAPLARDLAPALEILASNAVDERQSQHEFVHGLLASAGGVIAAERLVDLPAPGPFPSSAGWQSLAVTDGPRLELAAADLHRLGLIRDDLDEWPLFCAPDVMLIARDRQQLSRGDWQVVLSEVHHICPPTQLPFATFDPEPDAVRAETWAAIRSVAGAARPALQGIDRDDKVRDSTPVGHDVLWLHWHASEPQAVGVSIGDCTVAAGPGGRPVLQRSDGSPLALFSEHDDARPDVGMLRAVAAPGIDKRPVRLSAVTPRITIGRVVYQRQRWDLAAGDLPGRHAPAGSFDEFLAAWRWKTEWKMPDQMFARVPGEEKPLFLDFCSPMSVDAFLRDTAGCDRMSMEEMLPGFDDLWLEIAGERYCNELRLTAFRDGAAR